jgi:hypothetical protein
VESNQIGPAGGDQLSIGHEKSDDGRDADGADQAGRCSRPAQLPIGR